MPKQTIIRFFTLVVLCTGLTLTGCDSGDPGEESPSIGGIYTDTATSQGVTATLRFDIDNTRGGSVSMTGSVSAQNGDQIFTQSLEGTGTYDFPSLSLNIMTEIDGQQESDQLTGTVSNSGDILTLRDSGGVEYTMTRQ